MTKAVKKEIKKEIIGQNEHMTIIKVHQTCYGFTEKSNNDIISLRRVTKSKSPIAIWELKRLKFKDYYKIQLKDSFISQLKLDIGKKIRNSWGNEQWNYDTADVNEYIYQNTHLLMYPDSLEKDIELITSINLMVTLINK